MSRPRLQSMATEMVPLADRLRLMRTFRLLLVVVMGGLFAFSPEVFQIGALQFAEVTAGYAVVGLACEGVFEQRFSIPPNDRFRGLADTGGYQVVFLRIER